MTGETFFQLHYPLTGTERLFDLAQGIAARRRWLKKVTPQEFWDELEEKDDGEV